MKNRTKIVIPILIIVFLLLPNSLGISKFEKESVVYDSYKDLSYEEYVNVLETLPHFLTGTILDGNSKVIVTENGLAPTGIESKNYDYLISYEIQNQIINQSRYNFMKKYGMDPYPPLKDSMQLSPYENLEKTRNMPFFGFLNFLINKDYVDCHKKSKTKLEKEDGPHVSPYFDEMYLNLFIASDSEHFPYRPDQLIENCREGWQKFQDFNFNPKTQVMWGYWDASNIGTYYWDILNDLEEDWPKYGLEHLDWVVHMGLVKKSDHNGAAIVGGFFSFVAEDIEGFFNFWKNHNKRAVSQHELTHCLGNIEDDSGGPMPWNHVSWHPCIINYFWLTLCTSQWCTECYNKVYSRIWREQL